MRSPAKLVALGAAALSVSGLLAADASRPPVAPVVFEEVSQRAGVRLVVDPGRTPRKHQPETMSAGVAVLDYDADGRLDVYVVNGASMPGLQKADPRFWNRLYRNRGELSFEDVTEQA